MYQQFNLYNERKDPVVTVIKTDNEYTIEGIKNTQLQHLRRITNDLHEFKQNFNLKHAEELDQMSLYELL
ncbi:hypothetical protein NQ016_03960 [Staphylococcus hyicus]|uniref:hypothetical protein n=1 Tax=Staphylococcus hyicus TaxID=1284 RepID=UPI00211BD013|nr:hypothetical protein [Staphylococcus hyicus]MCQ9290673.1 hypothetical protein [Staphylococcus hyicus]MCQ9305915.1 hypothetical protein [Staphylococcus hyicus]MCQ9308327.1 hypothetical protein [Staphylococcus hyicus]MCQ9310749.1 hypothetical protein [Staphylococcus hyicus]